MDGAVDRLTRTTPLDAWLKKAEAIGRLKRIKEFPARMPMPGK